MLEAELQRAGLKLKPRKLETLSRYLTELDRWSRKMNLTALEGSERVRRLIVEPVWIGEKLEISGRLLDLGSGNGSPGIPLHVARDLEATFLVEARSRRAAFLRHVCYTAGLKQVEVIVDRFENVAASLSVQVNWISLQGVLLDREILKVLKEWAEPKPTILWITSSTAKAPPLEPSRSLAVPFTNTVAHVLPLAQAL